MLGANQIYRALPGIQIPVISALLFLILEYVNVCALQATAATQIHTWASHGGPLS